MKAYNLILLFLLLTSKATFAHYLWIETSETGKKGEEQTIKVHYGEYTYGVVEDPNGENFAAVKDFELWVIAPSGKKQPIKTTIKKNAFVGSFTPKENGVYTVALNNKEIDVIDYTQYDFGIFRTHYHSTAKVIVGSEVKSSATTNDSGLTIVNASTEKAKANAEVSLQVLYKGEPVSEQEVDIYIADLWSKKLTTNEKGIVTFKLPWATKYTVETTRKEETPGTYKGKDYEFIWHCATYCIPL
ncbi:DUF4198 domain-containing protein [Fulvivirga sediminis]|uniref:DUF4198 domain-containing protein n=1 Tax=Fulvivirga sediminis TaxID=2803949 RepID=A0A937K311_9BACT|nr:DUF4198 domain-containing protein [Fulvivirga sediminis]MBL3658452.1 DUF4198 domain-containing protein [Fulvivirga sediminis]